MKKLFFLPLLLACSVPVWQTSCGGGSSGNHGNIDDYSNVAPLAIDGGTMSYSDDQSTVVYTFASGYVTQSVSSGGTTSVSRGIYTYEVSEDKKQASIRMRELIAVGDTALDPTTTDIDWTISFSTAGPRGMFDWTTTKYSYVESGAVGTTQSGRSPVLSVSFKNVTYTDANSGSSYKDYAPNFMPLNTKLVLKDDPTSTIELLPGDKDGGMAVWTTKDATYEGQWSYKKDPLIPNKASLRLINMLDNQVEYNLTGTLDYSSATEVKYSYDAVYKDDHGQTTINHQEQYYTIESL